MQRRLTGIVALVLLSAIATRLQAQASLIILVRHAEKAAPTGDPGLTPKGEARANDLATVLADAPLTAIVASQYQRTQLTAAPTAKAKSLSPVIVATAKEVAEHAAAVAKVIDGLPAGSAVLVVGHNNTVVAIIAALGGPKLPDLCDSEYSTLFTLERPSVRSAPARLVRSRYGEADQPDASACHEPQ